MTPSKAYFQDFQLGISFVDSYLLPRSPEEQKVIQNMTCASIISTSLIEVEIFGKIRNICLHHLAALSSCNTRFEGEK